MYTQSYQTPNRVGAHRSTDKSSKALIRNRHRMRRNRRSAIYDGCGCIDRSAVTMTDQRRRLVDRSASSLSQQVAPPDHVAKCNSAEGHPGAPNICPAAQLCALCSRLFGDNKPDSIAHLAIHARRAEQTADRTLSSANTFSDRCRLGVERREDEERRRRGDYGRWEASVLSCVVVWHGPGGQSGGRTKL